MPPRPAQPRPKGRSFTPRKSSCEMTTFHGSRLLMSADAHPTRDLPPVSEAGSLARDRATRLLIHLQRLVVRRQLSRTDRLASSMSNTSQHEIGVDGTLHPTPGADHGV